MMKITKKSYKETFLLTNSYNISLIRYSLIISNVNIISFKYIIISACIACCLILTAMAVKAVLAI